MPRIWVSAGSNIDRANNISNIRCLSSRQMNIDSVCLHQRNEIGSPFDNRFYYLARYQILVPSYRGRQNDIVGTADTCHVINIHHDGILCNPLPYVETTSFPPVQISQTGLCTSRISVHDVAVCF